MDSLALRDKADGNKTLMNPITPPNLPISVVIPCFRCTHTIDAALQSVLTQTAKPSEIWLIDDCSDDDSLQHLRALERQHPDLVKVISLAANSGPGPARNAGWDAASQPWIAFLDADDVWHPEKLATQWAWLSSHPDVVLCGHQTRLLERNQFDQIESDFDARRVSLSQMLRSNQFPTRTVMIKRDVPFRFAGKAFSEDYLLWLQVISEGMPAYKLNTCLAYCLRPEYSPGGLSGNLWRLEKGELQSLVALWKEDRLSLGVCLMACTWSLAKFARRQLQRLLQRHKQPTSA